MNHCVSLTGIKGGLGKSTTATGLAAEWHARGRRVLLVDLDRVQRSSMRWGDRAAAAGRECPDVVAMGANFRAQVPKLGASYDVVILDCPPGVTELDAATDITVDALALCDLAILPCAPSGIEIDALSTTLLEVREMRSKRPELDAAILVTRRREGTVAGREARDVFASSRLPVLRSMLDLRTDYSDAWTAGLGPTTYRPGSDAARELSALVDELERRLKMKRARKGKGAAHAVA